MAANKEKQNLRFKIISQRVSNKVRFDGFTKDEIILIKTQNKLEQCNKELNYFWSKAPRNSYGVVDWDSISEDKLDHFEFLTKQQEKLLKKIGKLEDSGLDLDQVMTLFMKLNINSVSY